MEEDEDDDQDHEEAEKKQPKVEEKKKFDPPAPRQKTKGGDYIVTKINVKERVIEHAAESKVSNHTSHMNPCIEKEDRVKRISGGFR